MLPVHPLYEPGGRIRGVIDRALSLQQRIFGSLPFGPLYLILTVCWVHWAAHLGWDNKGLTIYTFLVSCLAIYMSWVVTNLLNRTSARDRARDDLEAKETERLLTLQREQMTMLDEHKAQLTKQDQQLLYLEAIATHLDIQVPVPAELAEPSQTGPSHG